MLVFFPVGRNNVELAAKTMDWAVTLGNYDNQLVIVAEHGLDVDNIGKSAMRAFSRVSKITYDVPEGWSWPHAKNQAWQTAARIQPQEPWLWWEPDSIPVKKEWLEAIANAYKEGGMPILGSKLANGHIDGVAVYPPNVIPISVIAMRSRAAPFDQAAGMEFVNNCAESPLLQTMWSIDGTPPSFRNLGEVDQYVKPETVLFHRNKDGTLIDRLLEKQGFVGLLRHFKKKLTGRKNKAGKTCIVQLGRFGDIINILPAAMQIAQEEGVPSLLVQKDYASLLDGVSYVEPIVWDDHFTDVYNAQQSVRNKFEKLKTSQTYGRDYEITTECDSFCAESWRQMGMLKWFETAPLVFDRRSPEREKELVSKFIDPKNRNVLVNLAGKSSPLAYADSLRSQLKARWGKYCNLIDLQDVKAHRLFDLLGLYDSADCLLTIDTSTLHLAKASKVRAIELITDRPTLWHGARPKGNVVLHMRYREVQDRSAEIHDAIQRCLQARSLPQLHHVYSKYAPEDADVKRRYEMSMRTHGNAYSEGGWVPIPIEDCMLPRMFDDGGRKLPYVKDLIDQACAGTRDGDVIVLTNIDTCFAPGLKSRIWDAMQKVDACYSFRRDFRRIDRPMDQFEIDSAWLYPGCDIFVFKATWWQKHRKTMPDMLLGTEAWDWCLRVLIDETQAPTKVAFNNWIYHERHQSVWESAGNRNSLSSQKWNKKLAKPFLTKRGEKVPEHMK